MDRTVRSAFGMDKNDWYKLIAIGFVIVFGIEMIALGVFNNTNTQSSGAGTASQQSGGVTVTGSSSMNITIAQYAPYVIVTGSGPAVDAAQKDLIGRGIATYAVQSGGSLIVNLNRSADAPLAAAEFSVANASATTQITYTMPASVLVSGTGVTTTVPGISFSTQGTPTYAEGSAVPATLTVQVDGGVITGVGNLNVLPEIFTNATVAAQVRSAPATSYSVSVPWDARLAAKPYAAAAGAAYRMKSYAYVDSNATSVQLGAISTYPYVVATQSGIVSIESNFTNESQAGYQLGLMHLDPFFPDSAATFANDSTNQKASALVKTLQQAGINATLLGSTTAAVALPNQFAYNGQTFYTGGQVITIDAAGLPQNATNATLSLDFQAAGTTVTQVTSARLAN